MTDHEQNIAQRIIEKCGGVARVAELTERTLATVYRWTYSKEKGGTGGDIPADAQRLLVAAGRKGLVEITPEDFFAEDAA